MRRKDLEITDLNEKLSILAQCKVCRLGITLNDEPYIVPMNFGYTFAENILTLYFHCAEEGKKIDILQANNKACFEVDCDHALVQADSACGYSFHYACLIGFGNCFFIDNKEEKIYALNALMRHQTNEDRDFTFSDKDIEQVTIFKLVASEFTGKRH